MTAVPGADRTYVQADFRATLEGQGRLPKRIKQPRAKKIPQRHHDERPNVLWLMADQYRGDMLSHMGHPAIRTPNLDRLAAEGVSFSRAYCSSPVCLPSRASMLSGLPLPQHQALVNGMPLAPGTTLCSEIISQAGYRTANFGKTHCGRPQSEVWEYNDNAPMPLVPPNQVMWHLILIFSRNVYLSLMRYVIIAIACCMGPTQARYQPQKLPFGQQGYSVVILS